MKYLILLAVMFSSTAYCANSSNSSAYADGSVVNYNSQSNNALDGEMPQAIFSENMISCPTSKLGLYVIPSHNSSDYGDSNGITGMMGVTIPLDTNGTMDRCAQGQRLIVRNLEIRNEKRESESKLDYDMKIMAACEKAFKDGTFIDPNVYPWAVKCQGMKFTRVNKIFK